MSGLRNQNVYLQINQIDREVVKAIDPPRRFPAFDDDVLDLDVAERVQRLSERAVWRKSLCAAEVTEEADPVHISWVLRLDGSRRDCES